MAKHDNHQQNLYIVMSLEQVQPLVLIYYNIRGKLQAIRNLIAYLDLPFIELHIEEKNEWKVLSQQIRAVLIDTQIDSSRLPLLVHEGLKVYDSYPIMAYICRRFGREDLLGRSLQQRARLLEILAIYFPKQPTNMAELLNLADRCAGRNQEEQLQIKSEAYSHFMKVSGYTRECCLYLMRQPPRSYVLGEITLIDFAFLQTSHYSVGFFGDLDTRLSLRNPTKEIVTPDPEELSCLAAMRDYITFMRSLPFYQRHREALQSKSIISFLFTSERIAAIRSLWMGDASMVK